MIFCGRLMVATNKRHRDGSVSVHVFSHNKRRHVHSATIGPPRQNHAPLISSGLTVKREERERERENDVKTWDATNSVAELQKNTHAKNHTQSTMKLSSSDTIYERMHEKPDSPG